ncbi:MAG: hypothetical protein PVH73_05940 [Candidatus Bathyarchaeota archaeon]|jgi:hypothetical protein
MIEKVCDVISSLKQITTDRINLVKILLVCLIIGIIIYPWPTSESYGTLSGFDASNLYIESNSNFDVQLNSTNINVKSVGPGVEDIHLALSDLPYTASFKVTVNNQSLHSYPVRLIVSFPLNPNQLQLHFSSSDQFVHLELHDSNGHLMRNEKMLMYSIGQPVEFLIEISTVQSSVESISITADNRTHSVTASFQSEVQSLLRDQSRLISVEVSGASTLASDSLVLAGDNFWTAKNFGEGQGNSTLIHLEDTFTIAEGSYAQNYIEHVFESPVDLGSYDSIFLVLNGSGTTKSLRLWLNTDWDNRIFFYLKDDFVGVKRVFLDLLNPDDVVGSINFSSVSHMGVDFPNSVGTWELNELAVGNIDSPKGEIDVDISDLTINILPHSLAYAPLTPVFLIAFLALVVVTGFVVYFYFSDLIKLIKTVYGKLKLFEHSKICLFAVTFVGIFIIYFFLFGLGDHAFDMFSQKLWSYDMAKYGLLSLYQRPAVTSAASMFAGAGTQHAIFAYSPLAGLYYYVIGHIYFLFSSNPNVYDPFLTVVVKSFQTITTLACGFIVFKIMRTYRSSWRTSFITMLAFLLNPLIIYDAAVWGHQDSLLILFLFLALWAYESNHPKTAFSSLALAIMVKATAFAPAALMGFLLIRKFGIRNLIDGVITGLTSGIAVILPFIASGASPSMLISSTFFRVFQFGTVTFQYPRSAAVSPDGYNIWPLITYFGGTRSRDRMWVPDYIKDPVFGVSYLLAGEIIFIIISLTLVYLATKKTAKSPGTAALLLSVMMFASTMFLTKTTARYLVFGLAYLFASYKLINRRTKLFVMSVLTFASVFAMHGLLVSYTGDWIKMYPAMSPSIPINGFILSMYLSDSVITEMILLLLFAFIMLFVETIKVLRRK